MRVHACECVFACVYTALPLRSTNGVNMDVRSSNVNSSYCNTNHLTTFSIFASPTGLQFLVRYMRHLPTVSCSAVRLEWNECTEHGENVSIFVISGSIESVSISTSVQHSIVSLQSAKDLVVLSAISRYLGWVSFSCLAMTVIVVLKFK